MSGGVGSEELRDALHLSSVGQQAHESSVGRILNQEMVSSFLILKKIQQILTTNRIAYNKYSTHRDEQVVALVTELAPGGMQVKQSL